MHENNDLASKSSRRMGSRICALCAHPWQRLLWLGHVPWWRLLSTTSPDFFSRLWSLIFLFLMSASFAISYFLLQFFLLFFLYFFLLLSASFNSIYPLLYPSQEPMKIVLGEWQLFFITFLFWFPMPFIRPCHPTSAWKNKKETFRQENNRTFAQRNTSFLKEWKVYKIKKG